MIFYTILFFVGQLALAYANDDGDISFSFYGMSFVDSPANDKLAIKRDGTVVFKSMARTLAKNKNVIGTFSHKIPKKKYRKLLRMLKRSARHYPIPTPPLTSGMLEELSFSDRVYRWRTQDRPQQADWAIKVFKEMAVSAHQRPIQAMALECSRSGKAIKCLYKNVGIKALRTVDPLGVSGSIMCLKRNGEKTNLHSLEQHDPRKLRPEVVTIGRHEEYPFTIKRECDNRIIVSTISMLINKNYKNILLGELTSNVL